MAGARKRRSGDKEDMLRTQPFLQLDVDRLVDFSHGRWFMSFGFCVFSCPVGRLGQAPRWAHQTR